MTDTAPTGPYIYQPFGSVSDPERAAIGRLYGVGGLSWATTIKGLTKTEAEAVARALTSLPEAEKAR